MQKLHFLKAGLVMVAIFGAATMTYGQEGPSLADVARKVRAQKAAAAAASDPAPESKPVAPAKSEPAATPEPPAPPAPPPASVITVKPVPPAQPDPAPVKKPVVSTPKPVAQPVPEKVSDATYDKTLDTTADSDLYVARISALIEQEKFKDLDDHARVLRTQKLKFPGSGWKLSTFYLVITNTLAGDKAEDADYEANFQRLKRWVAARPQSITPRVALAYIYSNWAWKARGTGTAAEVGRENWRLFEERTQLAKAALAEAATLQEKCPEWFHQMLVLALNEGWKREQTEALLEQAIAAEPDYFYNYEQYASYLLPKWYGEEGDALRFAERIADRIGGKKGDVIYFRIAARLDCNCTTETYLTQASWPRIKRGYEALEELYGFSNLRLNEICYMASKTEDFDYANRLFERIGDHWLIGTWQSREIFDQRKSFAYLMVNMKIASQAIADSEKTPEGKDYQQKLAAIMGTPQEGPFRECFTGPQDRYLDFNIVLKVARDSSVESVMFWPPTPPDNCIQEKLRSVTLASPPADEYWVRVTMKIH